MRHALQMALLSIGILGAGCSRNTAVSTGQVFITMQSGESVKLGLVHVTLLDSNMAYRTLQTTLGAITNEIETAGANFLSLGNTKMEAQKRLDAANSKAREVESSIKSLNERLDLMRDANRRYGSRYTKTQREQAEESYRALSEQIRTKEKDLASLSSDRTKTERDIAGIQAQIDIAQKGFSDREITERLVKTDWPKGTAVAITDADGNFRFNAAPAGTYMVFATGQRRLLNSTEVYCWLVPLERDKPTLLHNRNILCSHSETNTVSQRE